MSFNDKLRRERARSTRAMHLFQSACNHPIGHPARDNFLMRLEKEAEFAEKVMARAREENDRLVAHQVAVGQQHMMKKLAVVRAAHAAKAMMAERVRAANMAEQMRQAARSGEPPSPPPTPPAPARWQRCWCLRCAQRPPCKCDE